MTTIRVDEDGSAILADAVVPSVSIAALVRNRDAVIANFGAVLDLLQAAHALADSQNLSMPDVRASARFADRHGSCMVGQFADKSALLEMCRATVDASAWRYLMAQSGMRSLMSSKKREEFDRSLSENGAKVAPLTEANILAAFGELHASRGEMFESGVVECFRSLSWDYKTNRPRQFGKRIIVSYLHSHTRAEHRSAGELDDLMRVFHLCDGKPEADHRQGVDNLVTSALRDTPGYPCPAENDYIAIRLYGNGNGHVTFKRPDLVARLNAILVKRIPAALAAE